MSPNAQYITDAKGTRTGVLLPLDEYESLLEDLQDLAAVAERRNEERVPFTEVKAQLRRDGLL